MKVSVQTRRQEHSDTANSGYKHSRAVGRAGWAGCGEVLLDTPLQLIMKPEEGRKGEASS